MKSKNEINILGVQQRRSSQAIDSFGKYPQLSEGFDEWELAPLIADLSSGGWHEYRIDGPIRLECFVRDFSKTVVYTRGYENPDDPKDKARIHTAVLKIDGDCWIHGTQCRLEVYCRTRQLAQDIARGIWFYYRKLMVQKPAQYQLIKKTSYGIDVESIPLRIRTAMLEEHLPLFYGEGFPMWHAGLKDALANSPTGITLLEGPPGTGKTSYIRHLMWELKESHRFYFLPSSNLDVLKDSEFVDFWSEQRRWYPGRQMVVILEDSEQALFPRSSGNRAEVGLLLNITDGLLGEFLRLHAICTVNCPVEHLDPALLRPGRLIGRWGFTRLSENRARRIAKTLGKPMPMGKMEYSLAEVLSGVKDSANKEESTIGFNIRK